MGKEMKISILKFSILTSIALGSSFSMLAYAESMKETDLKNQIITEQKEIEKEMAQLYNGTDHLTFSAKESSSKIDKLLIELNQIVTKSEQLKQKNLLVVGETNNRILKELNKNKDLFQLILRVNNLFKGDAISEQGFNNQLELKSDVTLKMLDELTNSIHDLNQPMKVKSSIEKLIDVARNQLEKEETLNSWYEENSKILTQENYEIFQEMVSELTNNSIKQEYEKKLSQYKEELNKQSITEEKEVVESTQSVANGDEKAEGIVDSVSQMQQPTTKPSNQSNNQVVQNESSISEVISAPETRVDGFNFKGYHFDLSSFSGVGSVPAWTPYVFQWTEDSSHYLFERSSSAGSAVWEIEIGDKVVINGKTYTVFNIMRHVPNNDNAYGVLKSQGATVTWQTCESSNANSDLAIWFAA